MSMNHWIPKAAGSWSEPSKSASARGERLFGRFWTHLVYWSLLLVLSPWSRAGNVVGWGSISLSAPNYGDTFTNVTAKADHCIATKADGTIVGWGRNDNGQAAPPTGLSNIVSIAVGR